MARTLLAYGKSRTTKTSQFRFIAEYCWEKYGKRSRFVTTDTGSLWAPIADLVEADIVRPLLVPVDPAYNPITIMRKLRRGEWPKERDDKGNAVLKPFRDKPTWEPWDKQADSNEIGAYGIESLTTYGEGGMRDLREKNITVGDKPTPGHRTEDGENYAANSMNHYSMMHNEIMDLLNALSVLSVRFVYVTALEGIGEDDDGASKRPVLGPKVPGKAITELIPSRVMDCLHMVVAPMDGGKSEVRCYVRSHPDAVISKMNWPAGLRLPSIFATADLKKWPNGYFVPSEDRGIRELLDFHDEISAKAKARTEMLKGAGNDK